MKSVNLTAMKRQKQHCTSQSTNSVTQDKALEMSSCETGMLLTQPLMLGCVRQGEFKSLNEV